MAHNPAWLVNKHPKDLKAQIRELVQNGYTVTVQDKTSAQLVRKKQFSCLIATLSLFLFGVGFFIYLFYFLAQRDEVIYLDLETQHPDPHWKEKAAKRRSTNTILVAAGVGGIVLITGIIGAFADTQTVTEIGSTISYETVWQNDIGTTRSIVITPEDATRDNLIALGRQLTSEFAGSTFARVSIFTDEESAGYLENYIGDLGGSAKNSDSLTQTQADLYDSSFVAQYSKNGNTGLEEIAITLDGLRGAAEKVDLAE